MLLGIVSPPKQPAETFVVEIDFSAELDVAGGETITGNPVITSKRLSDGVDSSGTFLGGSTVVNGAKVARRVQAGLAGERHRVQMRITTSGGNVLEHEIDVPVDEDPTG